MPSHPVPLRYLVAVVADGEYQHICFHHLQYRLEIGVGMDDVYTVGEGYEFHSNAIETGHDIVRTNNVVIHG